VLIRNLYHNFGGRTLVFAVFVTAVICDAFGTGCGGFRTIEFGDALLGLIVGRVSVGQSLLVASPSEAHVGRLLPDCPVAPRLPGFFAI
jgi:hypothetical protein